MKNQHQKMKKCPKNKLNMFEAKDDPTNRQMRKDPKKKETLDSIWQKPYDQQKVKANQQKQAMEKVQEITKTVTRTEDSIWDPNAVNIKLVLVGDGSSGKTSLLVSYATDMFNQDYIPTVMESHEATIRKGKDIVKLQIYDTAGQDEYKRLRPLAYPKTDIFFVCFSLVEKSSFYNAITKWHQEIKENCPRALVLFVGTKSDLRTEFEYTNPSCLLPIAIMEKKVTELKCRMVTCSALTQSKLNEAFDQGMNMVIDKRKAKMAAYQKKPQTTECQLI